MAIGEWFHVGRDPLCDAVTISQQRMTSKRSAMKVAIRKTDGALFAASYPMTQDECSQMLVKSRGIFGFFFRRIKWQPRKWCNCADSGLSMSNHGFQSGEIFG